MGVLRLVSQSQVPEALKNGYSYPKCIGCPQAQYTREALAHKFQDTLTLILVVTPQGRAKDIKVLKPLPYGLTESAIEAVKKWKLKPATGPDGKPAAVRQKIWITFYIGNSGFVVGELARNGRTPFPPKPSDAFRLEFDVPVSAGGHAYLHFHPSLWL